LAGRNTKTNFDFFRLDTDFFSNKKIKALRRHFGSVGILTYLYILTYAYGNDGYYIKIDNVEEFAYDIAESIGNSNLTQIASVATDCINYLASRGEINKHLLDKGVISGESIQRQYIEMCLASKRKVEIKEEYRLVDTSEYPIEKIPICSEENAVSSEEITINSEEMQQSKINKNKLNNLCKKVSKEKKDIQSYDEIFADLQVGTRLKSALLDFIRHLSVNGTVMINGRLEKLILRLDGLYGTDEVEKCKEVRRAIVNGYKRLPCEED